MLLALLVDQNSPTPGVRTMSAAWLQNPASVEKRKSIAQRLIEDLEQNGVGL